jgi:hypothetical protein
MRASALVALFLLQSWVSQPTHRCNSPHAIDLGAFVLLFAEIRVVRRQL